jgi:hypothetical protein
MGWATEESVLDFLQERDFSLTDSNQNGSGCSSSNGQRGLLPGEYSGLCEKTTHCHLVPIMRGATFTLQATSWRGA